MIEGGQSRGFAALELQQADGRITNSRFESNADAQLGAALAGRNGRLAVTPATIFARFTQPVIVNNQFIDNRGSIIDIDSDALRDNLRVDLGRQTGIVDRLSDLDDNYGPLVRRNTTSSVEEGTTTAVGGQLNGMEVRGGTLSSGSIWDDTDIVHMLFDSITLAIYYLTVGYNFAVDLTKAWSSSLAAVETLTVLPTALASQRLETQPVSPIVWVEPFKCLACPALRW